MFWPYIIISYLTLFTFGLCDNIRGPLFPEILKHFAVSDTEGSTIFAFGAAAGFFGSLATRALIARMNRIQLLRLAAALQLMALLGLAFSTHFSVFLIFSILFGWSLGSMGFLPNVLVNIGAPPQHRQRALSGLHSMYGCASFLAPLLVAGVAWSGFDWRMSFILCGILPLSLLLYSLKVPAFCPSPEEEPQNTRPSGFKSLKARKPQLFLALMMSFYVVAEILISSRLALFMRREWGFDLEQSSLYLTAFFACMLVGRVIFIFVSFSRPLVFQLSISLLATALSMTLGVFGHPGFFVLSGLTMAPFFPLAVAFIAAEFPEDLDSAMSFLIAADFLMLILMHLSVGYLTDLFGISRALLVGPCVLFLSFLMLNSFRPLFRNKTA
ncbi:putative transporter [compost metagenome]